MKRGRTAKILSVLFLAYLFTGCGGLFEKPLEANFNNASKQGQIIVTADLSSSGDFSRMAIPNDIRNLENFDYYGRLKGSTETTELQEGELYNGNKLIFTFDAVCETSGITVEIYAFKKNETNHEVSNAILYADVKNCRASIYSNSSEISVGKITLKHKSDCEINGAIDLTVTLPATGGYTLIVYCEEYGKWWTGSNGIVPTYPTVYNSIKYDYIRNINLPDIGAGTYDVVFTVKKDDKVVYEWLDSVAVYSGMTTNRWVSYDGQVSSSSEKDVSSYITNAPLQTKFYVCGGTGCAYYGVTRSDYEIPNDSNSGTLLQPLESVQEAVNRVITANQSAPTNTSFEIYVDGRIEGDGCVADFGTLAKTLTLSINSIGTGANRATLDANLSTSTSGGSVINATSGDLDLTLKNLIITGGNTDENGGGICIDNGAKVTVDSCKTTGNHAGGNGNGIYNNGTLTLTGSPHITDGIYTVNEGSNPIRTQSLSAASGESIVAVITPKNYTVSTHPDYRVVGNSSGSTLSAGVAALFEIASTGVSNWKLTDSGFLEKVDYVGNVTNAIAYLNEGNLPSEVTLDVTAAAVSEIASLAAAIKPVTSNTSIDSVKLKLRVPVNNDDELKTLAVAIDNGNIAADNKYNKVLVELTILQGSGGGITKIGSREINGAEKGMFDQNLVLTKVNLPSGITEIGEYAFYRCSKLADIVLPDGLLSIGDFAFDNTSLAEVTFPNSLISIGFYAFSDAPITSVTIPESVMVISACAFATDNLSEVSLPDSSEWCPVDKYGLGVDSTITDVSDKSDIANKMKAYNGLMQYYLYRVRSLSEALVMFENATSRTDRVYVAVKVDSDDNLTDIKTKIRTKTLGMVTLVLTKESSITTLNANCLSGCTNFEEIILPGTIKTIENSAFSECIAIKSLILSEGIETIGNLAFEKCYTLESVIIPESVTKLAGNAFSSCSALTDVVFRESSGATMTWYTSSTGYFSSSKNYLDVVDSKNNAKILRLSLYSYLFKE